MAIKKKARPIGDLSQASLSDIAFLLLVFFIATTIFPTEKGITLVLPGSTSVKKQIPRKNVMVITTDAGGNVFIDDVATSVGAVRQTVIDRIAENENLVISIETHPDAPYGRMVDVLDEVKMANADRISVKLFRG